MRNKLMTIVMASFIMMASCTTEDRNTPVVVAEQEVLYFKNTDSETEVFHAINKYRKSKGLQILLMNNHLSFKAYQNNGRMISDGKISHNKFDERNNSIVATLNAIKVGEILASGYPTTELVMKAWMESIKHNEAMLDDYNHVGVSIRGYKLHGEIYTVIFAKI